MTPASASNTDQACTSAMPASTASPPLTTTLYDLVATVQDLVGPERDDIVVATVMALLRAGCVTRSRACQAPARALPPLTRAS